METVVDAIFGPLPLASALAIVACGFAFIYSLHLLRIRLLNLPPGPSPWPVLGNLIQLGSLPHRGLAKLAERFGPIITVWIGSTPCVVVSSPELAKEVLRVQDQHFSARPTVLRVAKTFTDFKDIAFAPPNADWKAKRKLSLLHIMSPKQMHMWAESRQAQVDRMVQAMREAGQGATEFTLTLHPFLGRTTMNAVMSACCGLSYPYSDLIDEIAVQNIGAAATAQHTSVAAAAKPAAYSASRAGIPQAAAFQAAAHAGTQAAAASQAAAVKATISTRPGSSDLITTPSNTGGNQRMDSEGRQVVEMVNEAFCLMGNFNVPDFIPWLSFFDPQGLLPRARKERAKWQVFLDRVIDRRMAELARMKAEGREGERERRKEEKSTFLDFLLENEGEGDGKVSRLDIQLMIFDMIMAGTDTSSRTVEWALADLVSHPHVLKRLQEEVDAHYIGEREGEKEGVATQPITQLPYLQAVIYESLRLRPVGPLLIPHMAPADVTLAGYSIPANTILQINNWAISHDPSIWPNPHAFNPSRWLPPNEPIDVRGFDFRVLPFGSGRRGCPGYNLGLDLVARMLVGVVRGFDLMSEREGVEIDMSEVYALSTTMKTPLRLRMRLRTCSAGRKITGTDRAGERGGG